MVNGFVSSRFKLVLENINTELQVVAFKGSEALDQPYFIQVQLVSEDPSLDLEALLHQPVYLAFGEADQGLHGQVYAIGRDDPGTRLTLYHLTLAPRLASLAHRCDQRVFQQRSVPQIIAAVLEHHGIFADAYAFELGPVVYPPRTFACSTGSPTCISSSGCVKRKVFTTTFATARRIICWCLAMTRRYFAGCRCSVIVPRLIHRLGPRLSSVSTGA